MSQVSIITTKDHRAFDQSKYDRMRTARVWFHSLSAEDVEKVFQAILHKYPNGAEVVSSTRKLWLRYDLKDTHVLSLYQAYCYFCSGDQADAKSH